MGDGSLVVLPALHSSVPVSTFVVRDPAKPFTTRLLGCKESGSKSSKRCNMHPERRLLTPISPESVSNRVRRSVAMVALACLAMADME